MLQKYIKAFTEVVPSAHIQKYRSEALKSGLKLAVRVTFVEQQQHV